MLQLASMDLAVGLVTLWALSAVPGVTRALVARLGGMEVARLMFGFGPRLAAWRVGATTLQLHALPLGAFSQIVGLHAVDRPVAASDARAFAARPLAARLAVLVAGAGGYLALALLVSV